MTAGDSDWVVVTGARRRSAVPESARWAFDWLGAFIKALADSAGRPVEASLDQGAFRSGRWTLAFDQISRARLDSSAPALTELQLGSDQTLGIVITVSRNGVNVLDKETQRVLVEILPRTRIEIPTDRFDPLGRYGKVTFPMNVNLDEAMNAILVR